MFHPNLGLGRGSKSRAAIRGGVALTLALLLQVALASPQERATTTPDMPDIASDAAPAPAGPVRHLSTATDLDTGLVTDTYVKPLGTTTPGEVRNTRPWGEVGLLERPSANASIVIVRVAFDIVHPDTLVPYPLDRVYNHHLVVHSRDDETDESELRRAVSEVLPELIPADVLPSAATLERIPRAAIRAAMRGALGAAVRRARGHSSLLSPCGVGVGVAGAGAEWRGQQVNVTAAFTDDPYLNGTSLWVEPPGTTWGVNAHLIDLRDVENLADAVQCNCEAYARRTPGTPQNWDHGPLPGGGIQCCGDGALAPLAPGSAALADPTAFAAPLGILYNVTWFPNTPEALANVPKPIRTLAAKAPMQTTLMVSSNPAVDGAACAGEYNARACAADPRAVGDLVAEERLWVEALDRAGDVAPAPRNQTCESESLSGTSSSGESPPGASSGDGAGPRVTVAWSHPFKLPDGAAYDVRSMYGHQHVGGRSVRFVNVTDPSSPITICDSIPRYGNKEGIVGDEAGFIVDIPGCRFDPPLRLRGGETYAIRSEYGADPRSHAPAGFLGLEGVMGYVILRFTIPDEAAVAVFSASGERTVASDARRALASGSAGLCVAAASSGGESPGVGGPTAAFDSNVSDDAPDDAESIVTDADDATTDDSSAWRSVLLSAEDNFTMSWRFTGDANSAVEFKLRMDRPSWMSVGVHRPGGHGMPDADMIVVQSLDGGANFAISEVWTQAYDRPRPKAFYGFASSAAALSSSNCAVEVSPEGAIEASFTRTAAAAAGDETGADIVRGVPTTVVWAHGHDGFAMDYHARHRGTVSVTW